MTWSKSNPHQLATYAALYYIEELHPRLIPFKTAGKTKISSLNYYIKDGASHPVKHASMGIIEFIVDVFDPDWQSPDTINDIHDLLKTIGDVLSDKDKTISDLADAVDACFKFSGEE